MNRPGRALASFLCIIGCMMSNRWMVATDSPRGGAQYEERLQSHCMDTSRVFATHHGPVAQLIVQLMCVAAVIAASGRSS